MKAKDIMSTKLVTIDREETIAQAARVMAQHKLRALIVERASAQDAYGIITETDISQAVAQVPNPEATYVYQVMTKPCIVVNPDLAVEHIAQLFTRAKIRIAPVIRDELVGIISLTDILTKTNYLTPQKSQTLAELSLEQPTKNQGKTESEQIYENWCSG